VTAPSSTPSPPRLPIGLAIASTLATSWGILLGLSGLVFAIPTVAKDGFFSVHTAVDLLIVAVGFALFGASRGLRRRERAAAQEVITVATLLVLVPLIVRVPMTFIGALVNLVIVGLTLANWRHLTGVRRRRRNPSPSAQS
jgi:glucan phosphoethanolaminetransferase (alkaline phosphatase superfamily)